jgi:hypothetical protein
MANQEISVLGIDIGRVIINAADARGASDTSFLAGSDERALQTPPSEGAFEAIHDFVRAFRGRVWLVSKCGPRIQALTRRWLAQQRFHELTGVPATHVRFCLRRPEKRDHCEAIRATHFIDDRLDVLEHLRGLVPRLYLFGHQTAVASIPHWVEPTLDFKAARTTILRDLNVDAGSPAVRVR